ncbi:MAG: 2Fe-2S iron-sulfur cluster binding domain-containing protein [Kordiimonadaceae bacterium]|nr:2Fe-2S iron-sulfur cluster binding domain-containing protein [Kordiimonadaceae bacterium]
MHKLHTLTVSSVEKNTPETAVLTLDVPVSLADEFAYSHGQHLTLCADVDGEEVRRSYSICSAMGEGQLKVAVRKVAGGRFSTYANETLQAGDDVKVLAPAGHFGLALEPDSARTYAAFAAGSGITPIISILKTTLAAEPDARFMLFYGNRDKSSTIFLNELALLKNTYMDRFSCWHFLSQEETEAAFLKGRLDGEKIQYILDSIMPATKIDHAFVCGPEAMIDSTVETLLAAGMADSTVHFEKFMSEGQQSQAPVRSETAEGVSAVTLIIDGDELLLKADKKALLLDAAHDQGIDAPFACKSGVCCTCRAKVLEGEAEMVMNQGLEPDEVAAGFILTCQSYAVSDKLRISFDE